MNRIAGRSTSESESLNRRISDRDGSKGYRFDRSSRAASGKLSHTIELPVRTTYDVRFVRRSRISLQNREGVPTVLILSVKSHLGQVVVQDFSLCCFLPLSNRDQL